MVYEFTAESTGVHNFDISGMTADLDIIVLNSCDKSDCNTASTGTGTDFDNVQVTLTGGDSVHVAVDGKNGANSGFDFEVVCPSGGDDDDAVADDDDAVADDDDAGPDDDDAGPDDDDAGPDDDDVGPDDDDVGPDDDDVVADDDDSAAPCFTIGGTLSQAGGTPALPTNATVQIISVYTADLNAFGYPSAGAVSGVSVTASAYPVAFQFCSPGGDLTILGLVDQDEDGDSCTENDWSGSTPLTLTQDEFGLQFEIDTQIGPGECQ